MAEMDGHAELAYLVSVKDLRDVCDAITDESPEYKFTCYSRLSDFERAIIPHMKGFELNVSVSNCPVNGLNDLLMRVAVRQPANKLH